MQQFIDELNALKARVKSYVPRAERVYCELQITVSDKLGKQDQRWEYMISAHFNNGNKLVVGFGDEPESAFKSFVGYMKQEAPEYLDQASNLRAQAQTVGATS